MEISEWLNRQEKNGQGSALILTVINVEVLEWCSDHYLCVVVIGRYLVWQ